MSKTAEVANQQHSAKTMWVANFTLFPGSDPGSPILLSNREPELYPGYTPLSGTVAHTLWSLPGHFGFGKHSGRFPGLACRGPVAHAVDVFFCVVRMAIAVAQGRREEPSHPALPQPLDRDTELACRLGDPLRRASRHIHAISIKHDT